MLASFPQILFNTSRSWEYFECCLNSQIAIPTAAEYLLLFSLDHLYSYF